MVAEAGGVVRASAQRQVERGELVGRVDRGTGVLDGPVGADPHQTPLPVRQEDAEQVVAVLPGELGEAAVAAGGEGPRADDVPVVARGSRSAARWPTAPATARPASRRPSGENASRQ